MSNKRSAKDLIKSAALQRRSTRINLRGDLVAQIEQLNIELMDVREDEHSRPSRITDQPPSLRIAERIEELRDEMAEYWLDLTMEQLPYKDWRAFVTANPAREEEQYDKLTGLNFDRLIEDVLPRVVVEPELDDDDWDMLFQKAAPADIRELGGLVYALHERGADIPKAPLASAMIRGNDASSEPLNDSESASDDSPDGSPSSSTSSTTEQETEQPQSEPGLS